jgi:hypothetical protein
VIFLDWQQPATWTLEAAVSYQTWIVDVVDRSRPRSPQHPEAGNVDQSSATGHFVTPVLPGGSLPLNRQNVRSK